VEANEAQVVGGVWGLKKTGDVHRVVSHQEKRVVTEERYGIGDRADKILLSQI